jgi:hypothetical protein
VKPALHCLLMAAIEGGECGRRGATAGGRGRLGCRGAGLRWEEELTSGAQLAATEKEEKGRGSWAGGGEAGWAVGL